MGKMNFFEIRLITHEVVICSEVVRRWGVRDLLLKKKEKKKKIYHNLFYPEV